MSNGSLDTPTSTSKSVLSPEYRSITISTLTAISLSAFDGLGVTAVQSSIAGDLGRVRLLPWVFTAFSLTLTIAALASGPLIDGLGLRRVYRITLVSFLLASIACAVAPSMETLILARTVQGVGGGLVIAVALAAVGVTFPENLRSRAFAANSTVWGVMSFAGPALAAALVRTPLGWRAVFAVNIPLTLFAMLIGWNRLPGRQPGVARMRFDLRGLVLLGTFLTLLLVGATELDQRAVVPTGLAIVVGALYWRHAGRSPSPILERRHVTGWPFGAINMAVFMLFAGGLAVEGYVPLFVTGALGRSRELAAFSVTFLALGWTLASIVVSRLLDRVTNTSVMIGGFMVAIPPLVVGLVTYSTSTPVALVAALSLVQGAGVGAVTNAGITLLQRSSGADEMGRTSAAHQFLRNLGSTIGIAAVSGVLFGVIRHRIGNLEEIRPLLKGNDKSQVSATARSAIASGYRTAHVVSLSLTVAGLGITLRLHRWMRRHG